MAASGPDLPESPVDHETRPDGGAGAAQEPATAAPTAPRGAAIGTPLAGSLFALACFGAWGLNPVWFKAVDHVAPLEILAHRIAWTWLVLALLTLAMRRLPRLVAVVTSRRVLGALAVSTLLIATNWLVYIIAIHTDRVLHASLGYFINPLVNVALGVAVLRERLSRPRAVAVALAAGGVAVLAAGHGLPWIALVLAGSFGLYGLVRKLVPVDPVTGLLVEVCYLLLPALVFLLVRHRAGELAFGSIDRTTDLLLLSAWAVTAIPLLLFVAAARRLTLTAVGFFQYIAPTGQLLLAVFAYGESFTATHAAGFGAIWLGLALVSAEGVRDARSRRGEAARRAATPVAGGTGSALEPDERG